MDTKLQRYNSALNLQQQKSTESKTRTKNCEGNGSPGLYVTRQLVRQTLPSPGSHDDKYVSIALQRHRYYLLLTVSEGCNVKNLPPHFFYVVAG